MRRQLMGRWRWIAGGVAILYVLFHIYTSAFGLLPSMQQRAIHVLLGISLTLMLVAPRKGAQPENKVPWWDIVLIGLVIASGINAYVKYEWFVFHLGESTTLDLFLGTVIIIMVIEAGRRMTGWVFPLLTLAALIYALVGPLIPGVFGHGGFSPIYILQQLYQSTLGVWGFITGISATIVAMMFIFAALLLFTGGGQTFIDIALVIAGRFRGGPALVAVVASSLFGTISGGSSTNVAATGSFTIPMMKRLGYKPEFAAGVEAVASTGGQITPPILGTGAFIMTELLGIPYLTVVIAAIIPAFLFYTAIFSGVRFHTLRLNMVPVPDDQIPKLRDVLTWRKLGPLFLPIIALLGLLISGFTLVTAGLWASITALVLFLFADLSLSNMKLRVKQIISGLERAGVSLTQIVALLVCANIVVSLISLSGVGIKLSGVITDFASGSFLVTLVLGAMVALVMGMGLPSVAAYVIAAAVAGPVILALGVPPLAGHLFIFYFAILSNITPPVCIATYVAAGIAQTNWLKVSKVALRLAVVAYFIPFVFVYEPALLMMAGPFEIGLAAVFAALGALFLSAGLSGYFTTKLSLGARLLVVPGAFLLLMPGWNTGVAGIAVVALVLFGDKFARPMLSRMKIAAGNDTRTKPFGTYIDLDPPDTER